MEGIPLVIFELIIALIYFFFEKTADNNNNTTRLDLVDTANWWLSHKTPLI